eukprot:354817-Chlamydomonas_euryale.AAC.1
MGPPNGAVEKGWKLPLGGSSRQLQPSAPHRRPMGLANRRSTTAPTAARCAAGSSSMDLRRPKSTGGRYPEAWGQYRAPHSQWPPRPARECTLPPPQLCRREESSDARFASVRALLIRLVRAGKRGAGPSNTCATRNAQHRGSQSSHHHPAPVPLPLGAATAPEQPVRTAPRVANPQREIGRKKPDKLHGRPGAYHRHQSLPSPTPPPRASARSALPPSPSSTHDDPPPRRRRAAAAPPARPRGKQSCA